MDENKARASDIVIHPRSPTGKALIDADNVPLSLALSFRASGGVWVLNAAFIVFHIPMIDSYIVPTRKSRPLFRCLPSQINGLFIKKALRQRTLPNDP
jgi:hypothetical protein